MDQSVRSSSLLVVLLCPLRSRGDKAYEFALVRDPNKVVNVYGYGYCDVFG